MSKEIEPAVKKKIVDGLKTVSSDIKGKFIDDYFRSIEEKVVQILINSGLKIKFDDQGKLLENKIITEIITSAKEILADHESIQENGFTKKSPNMVLGAFELLAQLHESGAKLVLWTYGKTKTQQGHLKKLIAGNENLEFLNGAIDLLKGRDAFGDNQAKPHLEHFEQALLDNKIDYNNIKNLFFVDDSPYTIEVFQYIAAAAGEKYTKLIEDSKILFVDTLGGEGRHKKFYDKILKTAKKKNVDEDSFSIHDVCSNPMGLNLLWKTINNPASDENVLMSGEEPESKVDFE